MANQKSNYHWMIVVACFLLLAVSIGVVVNCWNPLSVALKNEFSSETAKAIQLIFSIAALTNLIGSALVGKIMSKFSMRIAMPIYAIILAGGVYLWSICSSLTMFYIVSAIVGLGASGIAVVPCGALLNNWFEDKKGLAIGISFSGSVVGGALLVQMTKYMLSNYDWHMAYTALAIIIAVVAIPTTIFIVREHPRDKGLVPLGAKEGSGGGSEMLRGIGLKQYIKTGSFWLLAISVFLVIFVNMGLQNNISLYLTKVKGYTESSAANLFSGILAVSIFGKILLGYIYDKKGVKFGTIYCLIFFLISISLFFYVENLTIAIVFVVVFGLVNSMTTVAPPFVTASIVGVKHYATIFGIMNLFYGIGLVVGTPVVASIYDSTGSYDRAWIMFAILSVVLAITTILASAKGKGFSQVTEA
ncbi:MAG: MFS transporter [Spirochaetes bacterium]|nr:MFS transporter [Spirochaetota bacterium]